MRSLSLFFLAIFIPVSTLAQGASPTSECAAPLTILNFETLQARIKSCDIRDRDQVMALLPEGYLRNYALLFNSTGLQGSSLEHPRPVLFGETGNFILTFSGETLKDSRTIEMVQFRSETKSFEFREIAFYGPNRYASFSKPNPAMCLACHDSTNPRPLWETDFVWPGAFGQEDDRRYSGSQISKDFLNEQAFMNGSKNEGQYRFLAANGVRSASPNLALAKMIQDMNFRAWGHRLAVNPRAKSYRYALVGALRCPEVIENFLTDDLRKDFPSLEELRSTTEMKLQQGLQNKIKRLRDLIPEGPETEPIRELARTGHDSLGRSLYDDVPVIIAFRLIMENGVNELLQSSSPELFGTRYSFRAGDQGLDRLADPLGEEFFAGDPVFLDQESARRQGRITQDQFCGWLADQSRAALTK